MGDAEWGGLPIAASAVDVARGDTQVLQGVDVLIERGTRTFILGENGAGKSTLLRVLHGLIAPTRGTVTWGGDTSRPPRQAMVFQRPVLLRRSAAGNVRHALKLAGVRGSSAQRCIEHALARLSVPS